MADATILLLERILKRNGVSIASPQDFMPLKEYDIVLLLDDSGSMNARSGKTTRWNELLETASHIIEIACCFDADGIDAYFLNGGMISNIASSKDRRLVSKFKRRASGGTPLTETLKTALRNHAGGKPLLVMILSDGEPNGGVPPLKRVIEDSIRTSKGCIRYQLMACTSDDRAVAWMDELDVAHTEVDATDDYHTERSQVLKSGIFGSFERGDWIAKAMLGAISKKWNCMDDRAHGFPDDDSTAASTAEVVMTSSRANACQGCLLQ
eukprot:TRINITY_DN64644_c0_g1_i1.p1 TRINITY_DN64644_c0_g1~~TRINITY_DN64644_c0_g1_i1.p1  ORF type:complete len:267 (-),score=31.74 TRINITY_DN64644_c0_g1_i1:244-1044(-)